MKNCLTKIFYAASWVKKANLFLLAFFSAMFGAEAQTSHSRWKENYDVNEFRIKTIEVAVPEEKLVLSGFSNILVIDARADTGRVGFMQKKIVDPISGVLNNAANSQEEQKINTRPTFIKLVSGVRSQTEQFAKNYLSFSANSAAPSVLMVIKKLWLSDELNLDEKRQGGLPVYSSKDVWTSGADVNFEFYLKEGVNYYPLYRYDSVISKAMTISEYGPQFIQLAFQLSLEKMKQMDTKIATLKLRRKFSLEEIAKHNEDAFNLPVLKDAVQKEGVYMSFEEFKNNLPSQTQYEIKKDKLIDAIYIKQPNGNDYLARDIWGYCDGTHLYIKSADNFFLLQRYANAFYVYGAKRIMVEDDSNMMYYSNPGSIGGGYWAPSPDYTFKGPKRAIKLQPFQLDWETGKLY